MPLFKNLFHSKSNLNSRLFFRELINSYSIVMNKKMILEITKGKINEVLPSHLIHFLEKKDDYYELIGEKSIKVSAQSRLINWLYQNQTYLELNGGVSEYVKMEMGEIEELAPNIIFPLILHNYIPGIAIFSGTKLNEEQKEFFQTVFQLAALAYESVERIDREIKELDNNYQQKKMIMVGRMASSIAHEIRNPLTSIRSSVQLIEGVLEQPEIKNIAGNVIQEVDRINTITKDLLNFAKPRMLNIVTINLVALIQKLLSLNEIRLKENGIDVKFEYNTNRSWEVLADEDSFTQVLTNFMNNSIEAMENTTEKSIVIELDTESDSLGVLNWTDTGCGIQIDTLEHVMEPFFTTKSSGTGLGLAIVKQILDQHNYDLTIKSKIGKGTAISVNYKFADKPRKW